MSPHLARLSLFVLALFTSAIFCVADSSMSSTLQGPASQKQPLYLSLDDTAWSDFPKAPAPGSAVDDADLTVTLQAQATRSEDQKAEARKDENYTIRLVTDVIDADFAFKYPETFKLLETANKDGFFVTSKLKNQNARLRPYLDHPTLVVPLFPCDGMSYPSGHASGSELQARLLTLLFPDRAGALENRARQIADSRVVAGVHYASDVAEGHALGDLEADRIEANPKFMQALRDAAKADGLTVTLKP